MRTVGLLRAAEVASSKLANVSTDIDAICFDNWIQTLPRIAGLANRDSGSPRCVNRLAVVCPAVNDAQANLTER